MGWYMVYIDGTNCCGVGGGGDDDVRECKAEAALEGDEAVADPRKSPLPLPVPATFIPLSRPVAPALTPALLPALALALLPTPALELTAPPPLLLFVLLPGRYGHSDAMW